MLKPYNELVKLDITNYCDIREEKGVKLAYLNWARCKQLLHENGAEKVYFTPIRDGNGSSLIMSEREFIDKNGVANKCYETGVHIVIDDMEFDYYGAVMNGANPVKDNSMSQQRLWNTQTRLFVKGVAVMTGLGFSLWAKEEEVAEQGNSDDLYQHSIKAIKERLEREVTEKLDLGFSFEEIAKYTEIGKDKEDVNDIFRACNKINNFEGKLLEMRR